MSFLSIQKKNHSFSREQHTTETCHFNVVNKQRERFHTHPAQIPHSLIHLQHPVGVCQTGGKEQNFPSSSKGLDWNCDVSGVNQNQSKPTTTSTTTITPLATY